MRCNVAHNALAIPILVPVCHSRVQSRRSARQEAMVFRILHLCWSWDGNGCPVIFALASPILPSAEAKARKTPFRTNPPIVEHRLSNWCYVSLKMICARQLVDVVLNDFYLEFLPAQSVSISNSFQQQWGLCKYVIVHTILPPSPVIWWIELGGNRKWLPLNSG